MHPFQVSGIGNVMEQQLQALDITVCSQLMDKRGLLKLLFSETNQYYFLSIALGLGHSTLSAWTEKDRKSISTETTFKGTSDRATLFKLSADLCHELAEEMQQKDIVGKVLTLKLKTTDFQIRTRAQTLSEATRCSEVMAAGIKRLLQHEMNAAPTDQPLSLRLIGVRMSSLASSSEAGQRRQATLTQMFSQSVQPKAATSSATHCDSQEPHQSHKKAPERNALSQLENSVDINVSMKEEKTKYSQRKVTSIEQFLSKSKAAKEPTTRTEVYECSVCEELVNVESLEEFNKHLDTCLEIHSSPTPKNTHTDHSQSDNVCVDNQDSEVIDTIETQRDNCLLENPKNNKGSSTSSLKEELLCPVCEKCHFSDMSSLNNHIDECLNKAAINELLQESNSQHQETLTSRPKTEAVKQLQQTGRKRKGNVESQPHKKTKGGFNTLDRYFRS